MPQEDKKSVFDVGPDKMAFYTRSNGDQIVMKGMHLGQEAASALAFMINSPELVDLEVTIKIKGE